MIYLNIFSPVNMLLHMFLIMACLSPFNAAYLGIYPQSEIVIVKKFTPSGFMLTHYKHDTLAQHYQQALLHELKMKNQELQRQKLQEKETSIIKNLLGSSLRGTSFLDDFYTMRY